MDIVKAFKDSCDIYCKNFLTIFISAIVVIILSVLTLGILMMPLLVGLQMLFVKAKRGEAISLNDIFAPMKNYWALSIAGLWISTLICLGFCLFILPGLCWSAWWLYSLLMIADKKMGIGESMRASKELVRKDNIWLHILLIMVSTVIINLGNLVPLAGLLVALLIFPVGIGAISCAYAEETK